MSPIIELLTSWSTVLNRVPNGTEMYVFTHVFSCSKPILIFFVAIDQPLTLCRLDAVCTIFTVFLSHPDVDVQHFSDIFTVFMLN